MRSLLCTLTLLSLRLSDLVLAASSSSSSSSSSQSQSSLSDVRLHAQDRNVSAQLFNELEELSRVVDIAYCVGVTGIYAPFECAGRCSEFPKWELVDTWNTGPLMSDSCGYVALDHVGERIVVAFRGTYSIANTIVDLTTVPQEYVPYPGNPEDPEGDNDNDHKGSWWDRVRHPFRGHRKSNAKDTRREQHVKFKASATSDNKCTNCSVHRGFFTSWQNTRPVVLPHVSRSRATYPNYKLYLVGHSLGGAVAALAGIEFELLGWEPTITTFGEPRIGNIELRTWLDRLFHLPDQTEDISRYRRVTHINDPVPLLPLAEWGYRMHGGEVFISKSSLSPTITDLELCQGDEDPECIAGNDEPAVALESRGFDAADLDLVESQRWGLPARYKMWQLFFAHRDYFWRLGLCVPGGDPFDWNRGKYGDNDGRKDDEGKPENAEL